MGKIKVLQIITKADWAGAQRVVYEICKYIKENEKDEIEIDVIVGCNGILVKKLEPIVNKVYIVENLKHKINPITDIRGYLEIKKIIKTNKYDVVHCHSTKAGILGRYAAYKSKLSNIIYTFHGFWPVFQYKGIKRKLAAAVERYIALKTTYMVFISREDMKIAHDLKLGKESKYRLIYNSICLTGIKKGSLRNELKLSNDISIFGNVARIDNPKNPFLFIDIAHEYFNADPDSSSIFVWVGDGPLMEAAEEQVLKYNLSSRVFFIGFRENGDQYLADFNTLLMTSEFEGIPITILEAVELNIPILSSDVGGIKEIIGEDNVYKLSDSCASIAGRIESAKNVKNNSPLKNMANKYIELYKS